MPRVPAWPPRSTTDAEVSDVDGGRDLVRWLVVAQRLLCKIKAGQGQRS